MKSTVDGLFLKYDNKKVAVIGLLIPKKITRAKIVGRIPNTIVPKYLCVRSYVYFRRLDNLLKSRVFAEEKNKAICRVLNAFFSAKSSEGRSIALYREPSRLKRTEIEEVLACKNFKNNNLIIKEYYKNINLVK